MLGFALGKCLHEIEAMSARSFELMRAYMAMEPRGEDRMDWRFGDLIAAIANYAGKVSSKDVSADEMRLKFEKPKPVGYHEDKQILQALKALFKKKKDPKTNKSGVVLGKKLEGPKRD